MTAQGSIEPFRRPQLHAVALLLILLSLLLGFTACDASSAAVLSESRAAVATTAPLSADDVSHIRMRTYTKTMEKHSNRFLQGDYEARAYECDENNQGLSSSSTKEHGSLIRVCIEPTSRTLSQNVYILKINQFRFVKDRENGSPLVQEAVRNGADADGFTDYTYVNCSPGASLCTVEVTLMRQFYETDGRVTGTGEVALQFGTSRRSLHLRTEYISEDSAMQKDARQHWTDRQRNLQIAGTSEVEMFFFTSNGKSDAKEGIDETRNRVSQHWHDSEPYMRFLYVLLCTVLFLLCLCLCLGCCFWEKYCGREARKRARQQDELDDLEDESVDDDRFIDEEFGDRGIPMYLDDPSYNPYDYNAPPADYSEAAPSEREDDYSYDDRSAPDHDYTSRASEAQSESEEEEDESSGDESESDSSEERDSESGSDDDEEQSEESGSSEDDSDDEDSEDEDSEDEDEGGRMVPYEEKLNHTGRGAVGSVPVTEDETSSENNHDDDDDEEEEEEAEVGVGQMVPYNGTSDPRVSEQKQTALVASTSKPKKKRRKKPSKKDRRADSHSESLVPVEERSTPRRTDLERDGFLEAAPAADDEDEDDDRIEDTLALAPSTTEATLELALPSASTDGMLVSYDGDQETERALTASRLADEVGGGELVVHDSNGGSNDEQSGQLVVREESERRIVTHKQSKKKKKNRRG